MLVVLIMVSGNLAYAGDSATYTVKPGDVLWKVAKQHGTTWQELVKINGIKNPNMIVAGQKIKLQMTVTKPTEPMVKEYTTKELNEQLVMATLWMQKSAEYRALSYQAFNVAKMQLDKYLETHKESKDKLAIVVDADETVIDNSAFESHLVGQDYGYGSKVWAEWMADAKATALPGALEFLNYAKSKGVETFYVTNRKMKDGYEGTKKNLEELKFPYADEQHLLLRTAESSKDNRRAKVANTHKIVLFMGDNLNDFSSMFEKKSVTERFEATDKTADNYGVTWIVLPNPTYGEWEGAIYQYNWGSTPAEKDKMRKEKLEKWER